MGRIAVIGAGAAGLAAAWRLAESGREVVVYEAGPAPGGLLATVSRGAGRADVAVQLLASTYTATFELARAAGAGDLLVPASGRDSLWRRGRPHGITYGSVTSMAGSGALPALLKLKLGAKYVPWLSTRGAHLDVNDLPGTVVAEDDESIAEWGRRELGADFVEYLAYPLLAAYYGTVPERASAGFYHALAREGMHVAVHAVRGGAGALAAGLAGSLERRGVELVLGTRVERVAGDVAGPVLVLPGGELRVDAAIVATPPFAAAALLAGSPAAAWLEDVPTRPAVTVVLWLGARLRSESFGYSFPRREPPGDVLAAIAVQGRKPAFEEWSGDAVVAFPAPAYLDTRPTDEALAVAVPAALERALPGIGTRIEAVTVHRLAGGYRQFPPGHIRRLADSPPALPPGVQLAGDYLVAPTVEGAVRSGLRAAARVLAAG